MQEPGGLSNALPRPNGDRIQAIGNFAGFCLACAVLAGAVLLAIRAAPAEESGSAWLSPTPPAATPSREERARQVIYVLPPPPAPVLFIVAGDMQAAELRDALDAEAWIRAALGEGSREVAIVVAVTDAEVARHRHIAAQQPLDQAIDVVDMRH